MSGQANKSEDLFNPRDFESIELLVQFENLSTENRFGGDEKIAIIEVGAKSVVLSVPKGSCVAGNHILLEVYRPEKNGEKIIFRSTAKVDEVGEAEAQVALARFDLMQFDRKSWDSFLKVFSSRQEEIQRFFEQGKK